jgi:bis(5'-nucleosidyl)-tetraphosphatase
LEKEFSAGAIIFRKEAGMPLFLLLYSNRNKIWGFPKGHIEPGESEDKAVLREVEEEAGITGLRFVNGFRKEDIYEAISNREPNKGSAIEKHSVYFLCETKTMDVKVDSHEITDYKWLITDEAMKLLKFDSLKRILSKARISVAMRR